MPVNYKDTIRKYSKEIETIKEFSIAVRKTPGNYIGYIGNKGHINMIREVLQNSMDELQKSDSPCTEIWVEYYEDNNQCVVIDNGRGIPFNDMYRIFAEEHTSSNYTKKGGEFSSGRHGVGAKVTNALSSDFIAVSYLCKEFSPTGKAESKYIYFKQGKTDNKNGKLEKNPKNIQGTKVSFIPDEKIMGKITNTCEDVLNLINTLLPLMKINAIINFHGVKKNKKEINIRNVNKDGISTFVNNQTIKPLIKPISFSNGNERMSADISFTYESNGLDEQESVYSFANMCPTISSGSTHVSAFLDELSNYFKNYMNKIYLGKNSKLTIINSDIKAGLKAAVAVMHIEPMFSGQAKEIFSNADIIPFIKELVKTSLDEWCKSNASDVQRLCKYFKDVGNLRMKTGNEKITMLKSAVSTLTGLPSKYQKPSGKKNLEFILVEGDSAMSNCRLACDPVRQGLLPLRGKVKNAMTCSKSNFFSNEECKAIYTVLGCGEGKKCRLEDCKFDKIIFLGDADVDGLHIRSLLLKMFLVYYRPLVEAGRVYAAVPPLYSIVLGKGKMKFFTDRKDYIEYVFSRFAKSNVVKYANGNVIPERILIKFLNDKIDYLKNMKILSQNYAVESSLLEFLYGLIANNVPFSTIKKEIKKHYRFLDISLKNNIIVIDGLVGDKVQTAAFNNNMLKDCKEGIYDYIKNIDANGYILNDTHVSLYQLMEAFDSYTPPKVTRYKGLGEMNPNELGITTLHPDYNRTLIRYTTNDIIKEITEIRRVDSNKSDLLEGVDIASFDF